VIEETTDDLEGLLLRVREVIETSRAMPMSASVLVNREEVIELLDEAIDQLPEELRRARWLLKEREEFLSQARREAEDLIESARVQAERMVERTEVVREARRHSQAVVDAADAESRQLKHEAEDYIDQKLAAFEVVLERTMQAVQKGRERLEVVVDPEQFDVEHSGFDDDDTRERDAGFFDQDAAADDDHGDPHGDLHSTLDEGA